jgi:hypothetical protein
LELADPQELAVQARQITDLLAIIQFFLQLLLPEAAEVVHIQEEVHHKLTVALAEEADQAPLP